MKHELSKKILAYSSLATAALFVTHYSDAQIIYTNPPDIHLNGVGDHHALDLNNDGVFDVNVEITDTYAQNPGLAVLITNIDTSGKVRGLMYSDCQGDYFYGYGLLPLKSGKPISGDIGSQNNLTWYRIQYGEVLNWDTYGGTCHRWAGLKKHFAGFSIRTISGNNNYGWIRLSVNHSGSKVIIHDWAINSEINQPIYTGQTMKIDSGELQTESDLQIYSYGKQIFINQNSQNFPLEISIYNLMGEGVKQLKSSDENVIIQMNQFPSGIYIVKTSSTEKTSSKQVLIE